MQLSVTTELYRETIHFDYLILERLSILVERKPAP